MTLPEGRKPLTSENARLQHNLNKSRAQHYIARADADAQRARAEAAEAKLAVAVKRMEALEKAIRDVTYLDGLTGAVGPSYIDGTRLDQYHPILLEVHRSPQTVTIDTLRGENEA